MSHKIQYSEKYYDDENEYRCAKLLQAKKKFPLFFSSSKYSYRARECVNRAFGLLFA